MRKKARTKQMKYKKNVSNWKTTQIPAPKQLRNNPARAKEKKCHPRRYASLDLLIVVRERE